jgi:hypothetical protein
MAGKICVFGKADMRDLEAKDILYVTGGDSTFVCNFASFSLPAPLLSGKGSSPV